MAPGRQPAGEDGLAPLGGRKGEGPSGHCPRCAPQVALAHTESGQGDACCAQCGGLFLAPDRARWLTESLLRVSADMLQELTTQFAGARLPCPGCLGRMSPLTLRSVPLQLCTLCGGLWLGAEDLHRLTGGVVSAEAPVTSRVLPAATPRRPRRNPVQQTLLLAASMIAGGLSALTAFWLAPPAPPPLRPAVAAPPVTPGLAPSCSTEQDCVAVDKTCSGCSKMAIHRAELAKHEAMLNGLCTPQPQGPRCENPFVPAIHCRAGRCTLDPIPVPKSMFQRSGALEQMGEDGFLTVEATPPGVVQVGMLVVGETPVRRVSVPSGSRLVRLYAKNAASFSTEVLVAPGPAETIVEVFSWTARHGGSVLTQVRGADGGAR